jgi:hypothetical protein
MARKPKRIGRPTDNPLVSYVRFRCTDAEKAAWFKAAGGEKAFSAWARAALSAAAHRSPD